MRFATLSLILCIWLVHAKRSENSTDIAKGRSVTKDDSHPVGCSCGVFLSGQIKRGSKDPPSGEPVLLHEQPDTLPCTNSGNLLCRKGCIDAIAKHMPNSSVILCGLVGRDVFREKAHLFLKNCKDEWKNTNLSAGRRYCCKDSLPYDCPIKG